MSLSGVNENTKNNPESQRIQAISDMLDLGWWEIKLNEKQFICSDSIVDLLGLPSNEIDLQEFYKMIREDYRARVVEKITTDSELQIVHLAFPLYVNDHIVWVNSRFKKDVDRDVVAGLLHQEKRQDDEQVGIANETVSNLIYQLNGISKSLFTFLQSENLDDMVNNILQSLVNYYSAERAYIFEFNWKDMNQSNTYEAVSRPGLEEIQNLQNVFFEPDTWWNQQILTQNPIILNTLDDLPEWDIVDKEFLAAQNIKSLMVVPFVNQDNTIWGYAGIDIVDKQRNWAEEDYRWFSSLMHIINISFELAKSKARIQEDKEYLQNLYQHMPIGFLPTELVYDEEGTPVDFVYTNANKEIERITGRKAEEIVGLKGSQSRAFADLPHLVEVVNTDKHIELDYPMPDIEKHCRVIKFSLKKDEVISLVLDVTDIEKAHKALEDNEKLLRSVYDSLPIGFELFDKDGYLIQNNEKALEILGLDKSGPTEGFNIFMHPMIPLEEQKKVKRGEVVDFKIKYDLNQLRSVYDADFTEMPMQDLTVKMAPVMDDQGQIQYYLCLIINNTETTNAYLKIQEFEEYFSLVANLAKVGYFKWDLNSRTGFGISQWFLNLGMSAQSALNDNLMDVYQHLHPDDFRDIQAFYEKAVAGEANSYEKEIRVLSDEEKMKWLRCTFIVKNNLQDETRELIGVSYDITELKEMILAKNKAEALDKLKSAFLANMSHEIRTPLNSIIGFSDLLAETEDEKERKEFITIIQKNNELLLKLVTDILDLSKIESGTFNFAKKEYGVRALCEEVMQSFQTRELPVGVELQYDDSEPDSMIYADSSRVKQVLMNFITNSLKFTEQGHVRLGYHLVEGGYIKFYVEDTGMGISPENIEKIFDRFVKLNDFAQGSGLGLSICRSLVEGMNGQIGVESKPGKGSCFWFTIPVYEAVSVE
ncbi:GAF domain-containing protein [Parabacteroides sp. OttesenSCG-928-J18]|nr:GAF domain-containing protein [Parabacteroides sp. OttesenSCG-928-J18]